MLYNYVLRVYYSAWAAVKKVIPILVFAALLIHSLHTKSNFINIQTVFHLAAHPLSPVPLCAFGSAVYFQCLFTQSSLSVHLQQQRYCSHGFLSVHWDQMWLFKTQTVALIPRGADVLYELTYQVSQRSFDREQESYVFRKIQKCKLWLVGFDFQLEDFSLIL